MLHTKDFFRVPRPPRILALAPHPDDECVGCGGYLAGCAGAGSEIVVVFVSDGGLGPTGHDPLLVRQRRNESEAAATILGIQHRIYWDLIDGRLLSQAMPVLSLEALLREFKIELILTPHLGEAHSDHLAVAQLPGQIESDSFHDMLIMTYEVWTPQIPNRGINITHTMDSKLAAIQAYRSQRERFRLDAMAAGLGQYRAAWSRMRGWQYAECFQLYSLAQYREVCRAHSR